MRKEILYLSESDVEHTNITMKQVINIVEEAFLAHEKGRDVLPPKLFLNMRSFGYNCDGDAMPAYVDLYKVCGIKWIGGSIDNYKSNLPYLFSIIILNDPKTFIPMAIISGNLLTGMRTGAATAVAAKYLTNKDLNNVFMVGAGFQSKYQLLALREVLKIEKVKVFDIRKSVQEKFIKDMNENANLEIEGVESIKNGVKDSNVIVTVTTANEGLIKREWFDNDGCLICSLGTFQELDYGLITSMDKIIVDNREQVKYTGTLATFFSKGTMSDKDIYAELGEIMASKKVGRESKTEKILCVLTGYASEDISLAFQVYKMAKAKGIGRILPII